MHREMGFTDTFDTAVVTKSSTKAEAKVGRKNHSPEVKGEEAQSLKEAAASSSTAEAFTIAKASSEVKVIAAEFGTDFR